MISFRVLVADDLPRLHAWLNNEHVARWWLDEPTTLAQTVAEYAPLLHGATTTTAFIAEYDGSPAGYVQRYFPHEHPGYWSDQSFPDDTAGIDLFIGEASFLGRGFGPLLIRAFLAEHVFAGQAERCIIDPHPGNAIAIRAYEKLDFRYLKTIGPPEHPDPAYLMVLERADFTSLPPGGALLTRRVADRPHGQQD